MSTAILIVTSNAIESDTSTGYTTGVVIALLIFGYLLYSLIKPEKL